MAEFNRFVGGLTECIEIYVGIDPQHCYRCDVYEMHGTRIMTGGVCFSDNAG